MLYSVLFLRSLLYAIWPDGIDWMAVKATSISSFDRSDIFPIACHSHNDYWRARPLFTALEYGCSSIEADVWLGDDDAVLVGHVASSLSTDRTLSTMYLNPITEILAHANPQAQEVDRYDPYKTAPRKAGQLSGVFDTAPKTTLVLLIDFKSGAHALWNAVYNQLEPLRRKGYLTYFNGTSVVEGPLSIVVSGSAPFGRVVENHHYRDMFYDAPLDRMALVSSSQQDARTSHGHFVPASTKRILEATPSSTLFATDQTSYNTSNSYYASVSFKSSIGYPLRSKLTRAQIALMRAQIHGAHSLGLKVRYWGVPSWPVGVRNYLWRVMVREGVDFLSVDDVRALAKDNWGPRKGGWGRKWWF